MSDYLLGIDIGTTACKAIIFDVDGRLIARASREYPVLYPRQGWAEQDAHAWWNAVREDVRELVRKSKAPSRHIIGIGLDSQREAVVPLDAHGRRLANSLIWLDQRTILQTEKISKILPARRVIEITGVPIDYFFSASKIMWLRQQRPGIFRKTKSLLFPKDYVAFKLTGQMATDHSMASRTMLFDITKRVWSEEICDQLGIPVSMLPRSIESSNVVGELTSEAASSIGLRVGIPVVAGGGDRPVEAVGAGAVDVGEFNIGTGTATVITTPLNQPKVDGRGRIDCCCHVVPNMWEYEAVISTTGASLKWFRDNFGFEEAQKSRRTGVDAYTYLDALARRVEPGCGGLFYYPYPMGARTPKFNPDARAVFYGLTLSHTKAHFVRSILEGIAFQYAESVELVEELGSKLTGASIVGGEARSSLWNQIKTDVLAHSIRQPVVADAAALGSAVLASVGVGTHPSVSKATRDMVETGKVYVPRNREGRVYSLLLEKYKEVFKDIERAYHRMV